MPTDLASHPAGLVTKLLQTEEVNFTPGERSMVAWITTDHVDLEGEVVVAAGVDFRRYLEDNPIVLISHDLGRWPVGQCQWIKFKRGDGFTGLVAKNDFDDDPDAETIWRKVKRRTVRSVSVGLLAPEDLKPGEWGPPTKDELQRRPDWANAKRIIRRCVLKEYSLCDLGMNPHALVVAISKGLHKPAFPDSPEAPLMTDATPSAATGGAIETKSVDTPESVEVSTADQAAEKSHKCNDGKCDGQCKDMDGDDMDTMAMKPGDHVTCKGAGCGEVKSIHDSGEHGGMTATKAAPVAMVDQHDKSCMPTGKVKAFAMGDLTPHAGAKSLGKAKPPTGSGRVDPDDDGDDDTVDSADTEQDDDDIEEDDLDDGDNDDEVKGFRRHEHVKIKAPHYKGVGVIQSMHKAGHVPDVDEDIKATKDNPAARVQCYKAYGDGHLPTEHHVGVEVKHLTHLPEELKAPSRKSLAAALPTKPRAATKAARPQPAPAPALPPLTGKTPEAKLQDAVANLAKTLDPANLQKVTAGMADQAIARRLGKLST